MSQLFFLNPQSAIRILQSGDPEHFPLGALPSLNMNQQRKMI
jgi:hypothetical protein